MSVTVTPAKNLKNGHTTKKTRQNRTVSWRHSGVPPKGYTIEPADGKWSWAVLFGACVASMIVSNSFVSFGVLLPDLRMLFHGTPVSVLTMAPSIAISLSAFSGPIGAILMQAYSCRKTVFIGTIVLSSGLSLLFFINSTALLLAIYGLFIGFGSGLNYPSFPVALSQYFRKHYGIAHGFLMAGTGMAKFILAPLTEILRTEYGCRGTFLILGAISMNGCVGAALFQPPKWHSVLVPIPEVENGHGKKMAPAAPPNGNGVSNTAFESDHTNEVITNGDSKKELTTVNIDGLEKTAHKVKPEVTKEHNAFVRFFLTLDYSLLRWPLFYVGSINNSILMFSLTFSGIFIYPLGLDVGLEPFQAAMAISIRAFGEIVGRGLGPVVRAYFNLSSRWCTIVVFALNGILCIVLTNSTSLAYFMTVGVISGVIFGCCVGLNGQLIMENIGRKRLPSFVGLAALIQGLIILPMGPFLGWIRDVTGTYKNVFIFIGGLQFAMALLWIVRPYLPDTKPLGKTSVKNRKQSAV